MPAALIGLVSVSHSPLVIPLARHSFARQRFELSQNRAQPYSQKDTTCCKVVADLSFNLSVEPLRNWGLGLEGYRNHGQQYAYYQH